MIKISLTENYTGFNIEGTYEDFNELYDNIYYYVPDEGKNEVEEEMRLHLLGFLYDLRHAYQGDRVIKLVENGLSDEEKKFHKIKKSVTHNIIYSFNYVLPELLLDILIFRNFAKSSGKELYEYSMEYAIVNEFYSKVLYALNEMLTSIQYKKVLNLFEESVLIPKFFLKQWFMIITCDYIYMTKSKRQKEIMHIIKEICNWYDYKEYEEMQKEVKKYAKEHACREVDVEFDEYPEDVEW